MNIPVSRSRPAVLVAAFVAWAWSTASLAHCSAGDKCVASPCHHGPTPECLESQGGGRVAERITSPEVALAVNEVIIPKVPQLNLPVGGNKPGSGTRRSSNVLPPAGEPAALVPPARDPAPLPPSLPPSVIARDAAPQVFTGIISVTRDIEHERALDELRKKDPRLANSSWLTDHHTVKLGDAFKQLQNLDRRSAEVQGKLGPEGPYGDLREALSRASKAMQVFGSGDPARENQ
jgi:hypothetical protein